MISLKSRGLRFPPESVRCFTGSVQCHKSHYDTLKISPNASQADVKSAYYRLSKQYHPDTNVNDPSAKEKFQEISEAYEILGSEDSRMRYDKGMAPVDRMVSSRRTGFKVPEDPKAAFYKSRLHNKMKIPTAGRIYNFDDWTKSHYSASIQSNKILREKEKQGSVRRGIKYTEEGDKPISPKQLQQFESRFAYGIIGIIIAMLAYYELDQPDTPKRLK